MSDGDSKNEMKYFQNQFVSLQKEAAFLSKKLKTMSTARDDLEQDKQQTEKRIVEVQRRLDALEPPKSTISKRDSNLIERYRDNLLVHDGLDYKRHQLPLLVDEALEGYGILQQSVASNEQFASMAGQFVKAALGTSNMCVIFFYLLEKLSESVASILRSLDALAPNSSRTLSSAQSQYLSVRSDSDTEKYIPKFLDLARKFPMLDREETSSNDLQTIKANFNAKLFLVSQLKGLNLQSLFNLIETNLVSHVWFQNGRTDFCTYAYLSHYLSAHWYELANLATTLILIVESISYIHHSASCEIKQLQGVANFKYKITALPEPLIAFWKLTENIKKFFPLLSELYNFLANDNSTKLPASSAAPPNLCTVLSQHTLLQPLKQNAVGESANVPTKHFNEVIPSLDTSCLPAKESESLLNHTPCNTDPAATPTSPSFTAHSIVPMRFNTSSTATPTLHPPIDTLKVQEDPVGINSSPAPSPENRTFNVALRYHFDYQSLRNLLKVEFEQAFRSISDRSTTFCLHDFDSVSDGEQASSISSVIDLWAFDKTTRYHLAISPILQQHEGKAVSMFFLFKSSASVSREEVFQDIDPSRIKNCYLATYFPNGRDFEIFDRQPIVEISKGIWKFETGSKVEADSPCSTNI